MIQYLSQGVCGDDTGGAIEVVCISFSPARDGVVICDAIPRRGRYQLRQRAQHAQHGDDHKAHPVNERDAAPERWSV